MIDKTEFKIIGGLTWSGKMQIRDNTLFIDLVSFEKGQQYQASVNDHFLAANNCCLFNIKMLYCEIINHTKLQTNDQGGFLIVPYQIKYKDEIQNRNVSIPLKIVEYINQEEKKKQLYEKMAIIHNYSQLQTKIVNFAWDNNPYFKVSQGKLIRLQKDRNKWRCCKSQLVPKSGNFQFKIKITSNYFSTNIFVGVCTQKEIDEPKFYTKNQVACLKINEQLIYANGTSNKGNKYCTTMDSIIKTKINMNNRTIEWYHNDNFIYQHKMNFEMSEKNIYPFISMQACKDQIEILNK